MSRACLVDTTQCIGCRSCQVACKREHHLEAEQTRFFGREGGYQNPAALSSRNLTLVTYNEVEKPDREFAWVFAKRQCMHCEEPSCASACIVGALQKTADGSVTYDAEKCIGCRYCMVACPFNIPTFEWDRRIPYVKKCTFCADRPDHAPSPDAFNEHEPNENELSQREESLKKPACAQACPTGAIKFGERDQLLAEAWARIREHPDRYIPQVYGEKEAGGTSWLYLSSVPFADLGFPTNVGTKPYPSYTGKAMGAVPFVVLGVGAVLGGSFWFTRRREAVAAEEAGENTHGTRG